MAEFTNPPSWLATARFLGHLVMPDRVPAKGFPPLSVQERREMATVLTIVRVLIPVLVMVMLLLVGMVLANSVTGGLVAVFFMFGVVPVVIVTLLWIGLQIIVNDEKA